MTKLYGHAKELHNRLSWPRQNILFLSGVACLDGGQGVPGTLHSYAVPACYSLHWGRGRLAATRLKTAADLDIPPRALRVDAFKHAKALVRGSKSTWFGDALSTHQISMRDGVLRSSNGANHSSHEPHKVLHKYAV